MALDSIIWLLAIMCAASSVANADTPVFVRAGGWEAFGGLEHPPRSTPQFMRELLTQFPESSASG
jgi:hypothetical protein